LILHRATQITTKPRTSCLLSSADPNFPRFRLVATLISAGCVDDLSVLPSNPSSVISAYSDCCAWSSDRGKLVVDHERYSRNFYEPGMKMPRALRLVVIRLSSCCGARPLLRLEVRTRHDEKQNLLRTFCNARCFLIGYSLPYENMYIDASVSCVMDLYTI
jgi:hypothetical protein